MILYLHLLWFARRRGPVFPHEGAMGLHGKHILIDGYNLARRQGTGIKTYGLVLLEALHDLGAQVSVLWDCRRSTSAHVLESPLCDSVAPCPRWRRALHALRPLLGAFRPLRGQTLPGWVVPLDGEETLTRLVHRSYFLPGCFDLANQLFRWTGGMLRPQLDQPLDAWHATCPLPLRARRARAVTTIHDLIPLKLPWATLDDKRLFFRTIRTALARSDLVVTVSETTRRDVLETFKVAPECVHVLPEAAPFAPTDVPLEELTRQLGGYGLQPQRYLLFVGAIQPRKNLGRLCQALVRLRCSLPLVVVGARGWLWQEELRQARPLLAQRKLFLLGHVPREHLRFLYAGAMLLAFPSLYEGFGLPPLEAMAHGCPVLASNTAALPEVCGDAAVYADPYRVDDLAEKLDTLIRDDALRERLRAKGHERLEHHGMANYRSRLLELYGKLLS